ncbi:MAG: Mth938-like domain-containing protein [Burkholderiales bacterium]
MKLNADFLSGGENRITAYDENYVIVNQRRFDSSVIVLSDRVEDWNATSFEDLKPEHFEFVESLKPDIVLLGTGRRLRFPPLHLAQSLVEAQVGLEVMDTRAACRTYNILTAEGRRVAAALLIEN